MQNEHLDQSSRAIANLQGDKSTGEGLQKVAETFGYIIM